MLCDYDPRFQEPLARVREAASLVLMVLAVWEVVRRLAVRLMEGSLTVRAQQPELWPVCGRCGQGLQSKGLQLRTLHTLVWGDPLAAAGRTVSEGLQGLAGCTVGSGVGGWCPTPVRMPSRLDRQIKRISYAYNTLAIVSVAKWRVVQIG